MLTTSFMCLNSHTLILLQTAKAKVCDVTQQHCTPKLEIRVILDTGDRRGVILGFSCFLISGFSINPSVQNLWREKAKCK